MNALRGEGIVMEWEYRVTAGWIISFGGLDDECKVLT
jgi:hypothetical protein